jgi:hypothetical protein
LRGERVEQSVLPGKPCMMLHEALEAIETRYGQSPTSHGSHARSTSLAVRPLPNTSPVRSTSAGDLPPQDTSPVWNTPTNRLPPVNTSLDRIPPTNRLPPINTSTDRSRSAEYLPPINSLIQSAFPGYSPLPNSPSIQTYSAPDQETRIVLPPGPPVYGTHAPRNGSLLPGQQVPGDGSFDFGHRSTY